MSQSEAQRLGNEVHDLLSETYQFASTSPRAQENINAALDAVDRLCSIAEQAAPAAPIEISPEFTDTARAALAWVLWHHQGGSSPVGQPIRFALGMGQHEDMDPHRIAEAKRWGVLTKSEPCSCRELPACPLHASALAAQEKVRTAVTSYHLALDNREHGGVAAGKAIDAIQNALGMPWIQGAARASLKGKTR